MQIFRRVWVRQKSFFIYMSDDSSIAIYFTGYKQITLYEIVLECLICF